ncbi:hypothetical protein LY78DRAFT_202140 [Colletotrichum sublineola]|nr:hypothetical protein LY78DRAFT_202140 [Colletotrichum sublineola]
MIGLRVIAYRCARGRKMGQWTLLWYAWRRLRWQSTSGHGSMILHQSSSSEGCPTGRHIRVTTSQGSTLRFEIAGQWQHGARSAMMMMMMMIHTSDVDTLIRKKLVARPVSARMPEDAIFRPIVGGMFALPDLPIRVSVEPSRLTLSGVAHAAGLCMRCYQSCAWPGC